MHYPPYRSCRVLHVRFVRGGQRLNSLVNKLITGVVFLHYCSSVCRPSSLKQWPVLCKIKIAIDRSQDHVWVPCDQVESIILVGKSLGDVFYSCSNADRVHQQCSFVLRGQERWFRLLISMPVAAGADTRFWTTSSLVNYCKHTHLRC